MRDIKKIGKGKDEVFDSIIMRLGSLIEKVEADRLPLEEKWLEGLRAYSGQYERDLEVSFEKLGLSRVFVGITREKTNAWASKLTDMMFPVDDKNWGIRPTPVQDDPNADQKDIEDRAALMEKEIDDQLTESYYQSVCRQLILDGCKLGTGIIKGPVLRSKPRKFWGRIPEGVESPDESAGKSGDWVLIVDESKPIPEAQHVSPWHWFPDPLADSIESAGYTFQRHMYTKQGLRDLAQHSGFDVDIIKELLEEGPKADIPTVVQGMEEVANNANPPEPKYYIVWEYHGGLEPEEFEDLCGCDKDEALLNSNRMIIWFCQGKLLKHGVYPLDSMEPLYSVWNFSKVEGSIFGEGIPRIMLDSQAALNAAWRGKMDNAALAVGPQIIMKKDRVAPQDGVWEIKPNKIWIARNDDMPTNDVFTMLPVVGNPAVFDTIIEMAFRFIDKEVEMPLVAQGESGSHQTQTASGMSMLVNAANTSFKHAVSLFDDCVTAPLIRRFYDFNMQHSARDEIKGDFSIDARGAKVLLVKELQSQNLMAMGMNFSAHPLFGRFIKPRELLEEIVKAHNINTSTFLKSDEEIAEEDQQMTQAGGQPNPDQIKAEMQMQIAKLDADVRLQVAQMQLQMAEMKLAAEQNMTVAQLEAKTQVDHMKTQADLTKTQLGIESQERVKAVDVAMSQQMNQDFGS